MLLVVFATAGCGASNASTSPEGAAGSRADGGGGRAGVGNTGTSGGGSSAAPATAEAFASEFAAMLCPYLVGCCSSAGLSFDEARCENVVGMLLARRTIAARPAAYSYDAAAGARCLNNARSMLGTACEAFSASTIPACDTVFNGTVAPGAPCNADVECAAEGASRVSCQAGGDAGKTCIVERRVQAGDACSETCEEGGSTTSCTGTFASSDRGQCYVNDGLYCSNGACAAQSSLGEPCNDVHACGGETQCSFQSRTCVALAAEGSPCSLDLDCRSSLQCQNKICAPKADLGGSCTTSSQCSRGSCLNDKCVALAEGIGFLCGAIIIGDVPQGGLF